jgi:hypothetical protein
MLHVRMVTREPTAVVPWGRARDTGGMRALVLAMVGLAACADEGGGATIYDFHFTEPGPAVELLPVPGETMPIAWTVDSSDPVGIRLSLDSVNPPGSGSVVYVGPADAGHATWTMPDPPLRGGIYHLVAQLECCGASLGEFTATTIVVVQGVEFRDPVLSFTGADVDRDLWITATTASVIDVELYLAAAADAPRLVLARTTVASDLAPIGRVFRFTGQTVDGADVPAGDHLGFLEVRGRATYVRGGLALHWAP